MTPLGLRREADGRVEAGAIVAVVEHVRVRVHVESRRRLRDELVQVSAGQVERETAEATELEPRIADVDVVSRRRDRADVDVGVLDVPAAVGPQLPGAGRAVDARAGRRVVVCVAGRPGVVGAEGRDRVVDLDVEVVDRDRKTRREPRREDDAIGIGIGFLGRQVLGCRPAGGSIAPPGCRATVPRRGPRARRSRCTPRRSLPGRGPQRRRDLPGRRTG